MKNETREREREREIKLNKYKIEEIKLNKHTYALRRHVYTDEKMNKETEN